MIKLEGFGKKINDAIEDVEKCSESFKSCAQRCDYAIGADSNRIAKLSLRENRLAHRENQDRLELAKTESRMQSDRLIAEAQQLNLRLNERLAEQSERLTEQSNRLAEQSRRMETIHDSLSQVLASHNKVDPDSHGRK